MTVIIVVEVVGVSPRGHTSGSGAVMERRWPDVPIRCHSTGDDDYREVGNETRGKRHKVYDLTGLSGVAYQQHHVVGLKHTKVAVLGFGGVQVDRRYTCG